MYALYSGECDALLEDVLHYTALHYTEHIVPSFWDSFTFVRLVSPVQCDRITAAAGAVDKYKSTASGQWRILYQVIVVIF